MSDKIPKIKKNINDFLTEEEGNISKKKAAELAVGAAVLGFVFQSSIVDAHNSYLKNDGDSGQHFSGEGTGGGAVNHSSAFKNIDERGVHNSHSSCHSAHSAAHSNCHGEHNQTPWYNGHGSQSPHSSCWTSHSNCHASTHTSHTSCH